jgi:hypothetical protein
MVERACTTSLTQSINLNGVCHVVNDSSPTPTECVDLTTMREANASADHHCVLDYGLCGFLLGH